MTHNGNEVIAPQHKQQCRLLLLPPSMKRLFLLPPLSLL